MTHRVGLCALLLCALTGPAMAQGDCPVAADLATGIRFGIENDETEVFTRISPTRLRSVYSTAPGSGSEVILARGLYVLQVRSFDNWKPDAESMISHVFPMPDAELPLPVPGTTWEVIPTKTDGGDTTKDRQLYTHGQSFSKTYGTCAYDVIPVTIRYPDLPGDYHETVHYLPELGLSYLAAFTDADGRVDINYLTIARSQ